MGRHHLEVADIVRSHGRAFSARRRCQPGSAESRVLRAIAACRTRALGGHVSRCDSCGHLDVSYNSCRNRHCPKCQASARHQWVADREEDLLPVEYFHVVFTVPQEIARIALQNKGAVYRILFRASAETLQRIAADPKHLGARIGFMSVLHTWGQNLHLHPHVHCVVPGGGISNDGDRWVSCRPGFLLPVRVLGRVFRRKFLEELKHAHSAGDLDFTGQLAELREWDAFRAYVEPLYHQNWVVYSKPPFGGPAHVLKYLSSYTHRVAISNGRLVRMENDSVTFKWKDYAHGSRRRLMTLSAVEFLRRFLLHILPRGFVRIRHYGLFANRCRAQKLRLCRELLAAMGSHHRPEDRCCTSEDDHPPLCPVCGRGLLITVLAFDPFEVPSLDDIRSPPAA